MNPCTEHAFSNASSNAFSMRSALPRACAALIDNGPVTNRRVSRACAACAPRVRRHVRACRARGYIPTMLDALLNAMHGRTDGLTDVELTLREILKLTLRARTEAISS